MPRFPRFDPSERLGLPAEALPRHVAIIMDGNGRWAKRRRRARIWGHRAGVASVRAVAIECARLGIDRLTLYAFSQENWKRPEREVSILWKLLRSFLVRERREIMDNDIRFTAIGRLEGLPDFVRRELRETERLSARNPGMTLCLALNYGGRAEIVDAARSLAEDVRRGLLSPSAIDEAAIASRLYAPDAPDPDLLVRTAGEQRVSNFLLWQISYAEFHVTPVCWPEFREPHLHEALREYARRDRRFGALPAEAPAG
ncbi:MAG: isoprenyl transferase [Planctomycetes bacterium]|nr:isoprenyl transferase [Planctomycetota bacterium]